MITATRRADTKRSGPKHPWMDKDGLKGLVAQWSSKIGVKVREIHIRLMRRKWASISTDGGRMTLNIELLNHVSEFVDYVIVHELVHLKVPNHGALFKRLMDVHLPGWEGYAELEHL